MWRETVYSGTLRPQLSEPLVTGSQLNDLLDKLAVSVPSNFSTSLSNIHSINKIINGLYLGDKFAAKDRRFLFLHGFTHVLNAAEGSDDLNQVNTDQNYYRNMNVKYMGIPGQDRPSWNISVYFEEAAMFIENAIKNGGQVLVHCVVGISRSATLVIAYLMISKGMNATDALKFVFGKRKVFPNVGFLHHLAHLEKKLNLRKASAITPKSYRY